MIKQLQNNASEPEYTPLIQLAKRLNVNVTATPFTNRPMGGTSQRTRRRYAFASIDSNCRVTHLVRR